MDGSPGMSVDEQPVADGVDEVRGDERDGDGADVVEGLQVAAEGEVEEERGGAVVECTEERDGAGEDVVVDGEAEHDGWGADDDEDECEGEAGGEEEAVEKAAVGLVEGACHVRLGRGGGEV